MEVVKKKRISYSQADPEGGWSPPAVTIFTRLTTFTMFICVKLFHSFTIFTCWSVATTQDVLVPNVTFSEQICHFSFSFAACMT